MKYIHFFEDKYSDYFNKDYIGRLFDDDVLGAGIPSDIAAAYHIVLKFIDKSNKIKKSETFYWYPPKKEIFIEDLAAFFYYENINGEEYIGEKPSITIYDEKYYIPNKYTKKVCLYSAGMDINIEELIDIIIECSMRARSYKYNL
jgi:hypothetical protein